MTSRIPRLATIDAFIACLSLGDYEKRVATIGRTFDALSTKRSQRTAIGTGLRLVMAGLQCAMLSCTSPMVSRETDIERQLEGLHRRRGR